MHGIDGSFVTAVLLSLLIFFFGLKKNEIHFFFLEDKTWGAIAELHINFTKTTVLEFVGLSSNVVKKKEKTCGDQTGTKKSPFILGNNRMNDRICPLGLLSIPFHRIHLIPSG